MLSRLDPIRELANFENTFERFFESGWAGRIEFPLDVSETEDGYTVKASIPGINPDDLNITYGNNLLTIKGEFKDDHEEQQARYYLRERRVGAFQRSVVLPARIDADHIDAAYEAGVLRLFLPKTEDARPKRIPIQSGAESRMIEGKVNKSS